MRQKLNSHFKLQNSSQKRRKISQQQILLTAKLLPVMQQHQLRSHARYGTTRATLLVNSRRQFVFSISNAFHSSKPNECHVRTRVSHG